MKWFKSLDKEFIGRADMKGFNFLQLESTSKAVLYSVDKLGKTHYEVFKNKGRYPYTNAFGVWAWCYNDKESAYKKFELLNIV